MMAKRYNKLDEDTNNESKSEDQEIPNEADIELNSISDSQGKPSTSIVISHLGKNIVVPRHIYHEVKEMKELMEVKDRKLPRIFGRTLIVSYNSKNEPSLTIGPHFPLSLCLIVTIVVLCIVFTISMFKKVPALCIIGLFIVIVHLVSFLTTMLLNPGIPKSKITDDDITKVIERQAHWCDSCKRKLG
jgi:hypothetical protein